MRRRFIALAIAAIALGAATLVYRGPGRAIVRGHVGDGAATMLVFAVLSLVWRARPAARAIATIAIATAVELGQLVWHATSTPGELLIGGTFDGWDFVAYIAGTCVGWIVARMGSNRLSQASQASHRNRSRDRIGLSTCAEHPKSRSPRGARPASARCSRAIRRFARCATR